MLAASALTRPSRIACGALLLVLAGCAAGPSDRLEAPPRADTIPATTQSQTIVAAATSAIGTPYRYGGADRSGFDCSGFDCSGLVTYSFIAAGIAVPRTARDQQRAAVPVPREGLLPGDLVFFSTTGKGTDHVGIYTGAGRFVHAPSSGRVVSYAYLDDPWYSRRYLGAGRLWSSGEKGCAATKGPC